MGSDKALLKFGEVTVIQHLIVKLSQISSNILVVLGDNFENVKAQIQNTKIQFNELHDLGMFSSLQKGLSNFESGATFVQMVDQPFVSLEIYRKMISKFDAECFVIQPSFQMKAGHPLLISEEFSKIIQSYPVNYNLKKIIDKYSQKRKFVEVDNESVLHNLNTKMAFLNEVKKELI